MIRKGSNAIMAINWTNELIHPVKFSAVYSKFVWFVGLLIKPAKGINKGLHLWLGQSAFTTCKAFISE